MSFTLAQLAEKVNVEVIGDADCRIEAVATLQAAKNYDITFLANTRYRRYLTSTQASAVILGPKDVALCPVPALVSDNPYLVFARIAALLNPVNLPAAVRHVTAVSAPDCDIDASVSLGAHVVIESGAKIAANVVISAGCVIGRNTEIGTGSYLHPNVTLYHEVKVGTNAVIHSGAVIGSDGFGMASDAGRWVKVPQLGSVLVGDDVEIGANTTIDRGALEDTVIEEGVRLDNQIQVAHNVRIGAHTAVAGCVGIAGSTHIGQRCQIGGGVGIVGHLSIVDDVYITAMSLVTGDIKTPGLYSSGTSLESNRSWQKNAVRFRQLNDMAGRLKELERRVFEE